MEEQGHGGARLRRAWVPSFLNRGSTEALFTCDGSCRCMNLRLLISSRNPSGFWLATVALFLLVSFGFAADPPPLPPLTTVSGSPRLPGKFVWADLVTDDVAAAQKFYGQLFGWTFREAGGYVL